MKWFKSGSVMEERFYKSDLEVRPTCVGVGALAPCWPSWLGAQRRAKLLEGLTRGLLLPTSTSGSPL